MTMESQSMNQYTNLVSGNSAHPSSSSGRMRVDQLARWPSLRRYLALTIAQMVQYNSGEMHCHRNAMPGVILQV